MEKKHNEPTTQINTTLTIAERNKYKTLGMPWNRLIRLGAASLNNNNQTNNNIRLEKLEKAYGELRERYFKVTRQLQELQEDKNAN